MKQFLYLNNPVGLTALSNCVKQPIVATSVAGEFQVASYDSTNPELTEITIHYPGFGDLIAGGAEIICSWREFSTVSEWLAYNQATDPEFIKWSVPVLQILYAMGTVFPEIRSFTYTVDEEIGLFFTFRKENVY